MTSLLVIINEEKDKLNKKLTKVMPLESNYSKKIKNKKINIYQQQGHW